MWGVKSEPVLQFLHFWFCVGAAVIPFIMKPFINEVHSKNITFIRNNTVQSMVYFSCVKIVCYILFGDGKTFLQSYLKRVLLTCMIPTTEHFYCERYNLVEKHCRVTF